MMDNQYIKYRNQLDSYKHTLDPQIYRDTFGKEYLILVNSTETGSYVNIFSLKNISIHFYIETADKILNYKYIQAIQKA